ncbi:YitT family protein [Sulfurospirillum oryzae]|uniref:YitT family protein n=1 Tax=Sulfurospirillum oryzae TaxID=2976535 RepID=UPI0021E8D376|nr:YitT family protein [Sulfurospirillum oryzae]
MKSELKNYSYIFLGSLSLSFGVVALFIPNALVTGGTSGMALLGHYIFKLPVGVLMMLINAPLLLLGTKYFGRHFTIRSIIAIGFTSLCIDVMVEFLHVKALSHDVILASIFGGIAIGIGLGFILSGHASAGGSTIIAKIVASKTSIKASSVMLFIDMLIIIAIAFISKNVDLALWSLVSIYITAKSVDMFLTRGPAKKVVHIVSSKIEELCSQIVLHLGKNGTIVQGDGIYAHENKRMIFLVVENRKVPLLKELIQKIDSEAFMVVMEASELLGRGH